MRPPRKLAVFLGAAAMLGGAGCGSAASGDTQSSSAAPSQSQSRRPGGPGAPDLSALASRLGVSEARLQQAMQAARPGAGSSAPSSPDAMASALARQLGLTTAKVQAALKALMPQGGPPQGTMPPRGSTQPPGASTTEGAAAA
jgi:hypothetical protein